MFIRKNRPTARNRVSIINQGHHIQHNQIRNRQLLINRTDNIKRNNRENSHTHQMLNMIDRIDPKFWDLNSLQRNRIHEEKIKE